MQRTPAPCRLSLRERPSFRGAKGDNTGGAKGELPRYGLALLTALVCLVVLSAMSVSLVRTVLARLREAELHAHQLQADALAQSALERGSAQKALNPAYSGEVWAPVVPGSPRMHAGIQWVDGPNGGSLRVICIVPADAPRPVRVERVVSVSNPQPAKAE
jgi:hypothetical protein